MTARWRTLKIFYLNSCRPTRIVPDSEPTGRFAILVATYSKGRSWVERPIFAPRSGSSRYAFFCLILVGIFAMAGCGGDSSGNSNSKPGGVPADIQAIFNKPAYKGAVWGLRVLDVKTGKVLIDLNSDSQLLIGSVRKIFSVGELLDQVGSDHTYDTPVYRKGKVDGKGVLQGDLIMVASGDLTMGGRTNPDGSIAISDFDHSEADSLGNAVLTAPNPLAGYIALAKQVAAASITEIAGDVVIDDRLFQPYLFRNEFEIRPIFVNDDAVDLTINPTTSGNPASVVSCPVSAALIVNNNLMTTAPGSDYTLELDPELPQCIGVPGCTAQIRGDLPVDHDPPLTNKFPVVQTFAIVQPSNYARTIFIEALQGAGVTVDAASVEQNPVQLLPPRNSYASNTKVAQLTGLTYATDSKLILK
jgi:D-alanyl-D-alanine carboxypeptidase